MRLAFAVDGSEDAAGVVLRSEGGTVVGEARGEADPQRVRDQVARILSLDVHAEDWPRVGERDGVIGRLQAEHAGLRPVLFHSPYEAACWSVLAVRRGRRQAMGVRDRLARELGAVFELGGEERAAWPGPRALLDGLAPGLGVGEEHVRRLRGVAEAALDGRLDVGRLRALGPQGARDAVGELRGLGPFYAGLVAVRAVGFTDALPESETRVRAAAARFYGLDSAPDDAGWAALAEPWRPYRTWASVLLRVASE